jgi:hypothetical protein
MKLMDLYFDYCKKVILFPINFYSNKNIKKSTKIIVSIIGISLILLLSNKKTNTNSLSGDSNIVIGQTYNFYDGVGVGKLHCVGCGSIWKLEVKSDGIISIYSVDIDMSNLKEKPHTKSCDTEFNYKYDSKNGVFEILGGVNKYVSQQCLDRFVGKWKFKNGEFGERFYSENISGVDFH